MPQKTPKKTAPRGAEAGVLYATPALDKGLDILELLAHERNGLTKSEIARALNRTVSEIFRMLVCLQRRGYIIETGNDNYVLSLRLFQLVQEHPPTERLLAEALPRMHLLAEKLQQSCHLGVLEAGRVVILAQTNAPASVGLYVKAGSSVDLMEAATGQVILAHLPKEARLKVLAEWQQETGRDVPADLHGHLENIHRRGYEKRMSYQVKGVINISYPIVGEGNRAVAALTVPFIQRLGSDVLPKEAEDALLSTSQEISAAIGAHLRRALRCRKWHDNPRESGVSIMRFLIARLFAMAPALLLAGGAGKLTAQQVAATAPWAIAIHGGAGEAEWLSMDAATAKAYRESLTRALAAGTAVLQKQGSAIDAVQASIEVLEDDPLFNAGRGAAFAADGTNEMDASLMNGADRSGAGVAGVHFTRHPIALARAVMEHTQYVLMTGPGADAFSKAQGLQQEPATFFFTGMRWKEFEDVMRKSHRPVPARPAGVVPAQASLHGRGSLPQAPLFSHRYGTVGAVARDSAGHLAAATSTGGMQGKLPGRVGDSPILGAGTYADDRGCAISGTGVGEYFIRLSLAHSIGALCQAGQAPQAAADQLIHGDLPALPGGEGGVIVLGKTGVPVWSNNTLGMFHAQQTAGSAGEVWIK